MGSYIGTNNGDIINIHRGVEIYGGPGDHSGDGHLKFTLGLGNDIVTIDEVSTDNFTFTYKGGDDTIKHGESDDFFDNESVKINIEFTYAESTVIRSDLGDFVIITPKGTLSIIGMNPQIHFSSGEVVTIDEFDVETVVLPPSGQTIRFNGEWGNDVYIAPDDDNRIYYTLGGNDVITAGGGDDVIYGYSGSNQLFGGAGNDELYGGIGSDNLDGGAGIDTIYGGDGDDRIDGGADDDIIDAGDGSDIIYVGEDADTATGGAGADTYIIKSDAYAGGTLTITDFDVTQDRIDFSFINEITDFNSFFINGSSNASFYIADFQYEIILTGVNEATLNASHFAFASGSQPYAYVLPFVPSTVVTGDNTDNFIDEDFTFDPVLIQGLGGNDEIIGSWYNDYIYGGDGDDIINGSRGDDVIYGGSGSDLLKGGRDNDFYVFDSDNDSGYKTIVDEYGINTIVLEGSIITYDIDFYSFNGNLSEITIYDNALQGIILDHYTGDGFIDYIVVQDVVYNLNDVYSTGIWTPYVSDANSAPNAFDDLITIDRGGVVTGSLFSNNGSGTDYDPDGLYLEVDAMSVTGAYGTFDLLTDGSFTFTGTQNHVGTEVISYTLRDAGGKENTANITLNSIVTNLAPVVQSMDTSITLQTGVALSFISNFIDPDGDAITYSATLQDGSALPSYIVVDPVTGNLTGTLPSTSQATIGVRLIATDWMSQTTYDLDLNVYDVLTGTTSGEAIYGASGVDTINGLAGLDYLWGYEGNDIIYGGYGEDRLYGGLGDDILYGERDNDRIYGHEGNDTIYGGIGWDILYGLEGDDLIYGGIGNDVIRGDDASALATYIGAGDDEIHGEDGSDTISGGAGNDLLYGDAGNDIIYGNAGNDEIHGGDHVDRLYGLDDADVIYGDDGNDYLYGGLGDDILNGGNGVDIIYGNEGSDTVYGGNDADYIYGLDDNDTLYGESGSDRIYGHLGDDFLDGGIDNDFLYGLEGNDILYGGSGADRLIGDDDPATAGFVGAGNDTLYGGADNDILGGGAGDDLLYGGTGQDTLYGNAGADTFAYASGDLDGSRDYINDFSIADGDVIDISDVIDFSSANGDVISDFVTFNDGTTAFNIDIDQDGTGSAFASTAVANISGNVGLDLNALIASGNLIVE